MTDYNVKEPEKYGKLLDCPFCGSKAKVTRPMGDRTRSKVPPYYGTPHFRVVCSDDNCFCSGPANALQYVAVTRWNTRS